MVWQSDRRSVSPAPAGIDPGPSWHSRHCVGLPRTRGDRPDPTVPERQVSESPPHPRGSTLLNRQHALSVGVSPAPAGIDPTGWPSHDPRHGLPRTRGDRPLTAELLERCAVSPPHPRGSTLADDLTGDDWDVSPAPAGIDPRRKRMAPRWRCLPRTRGDRPNAGSTRSSVAMSPPHPRGSTRRYG